MVGSEIKGFINAFKLILNLESWFCLCECSRIPGIILGGIVVVWLEVFYGSIGKSFS